MGEKILFIRVKSSFLLLLSSYGNVFRIRVIRENVKGAMACDWPETPSGVIETAGSGHDNMLWKAG